MYDQSEAKASYYGGEETTESQSPVSSASRRLSEAIDAVEALSEKLGSTLSPVLRPSDPTPPDNRAELSSVGQPSQHVLHLLKAKDRVERVADRLRSLLERVEV